MFYYYINIGPNDQREVHRLEGCNYQPYGFNREPVGYYDTMSEAVRAARSMGHRRANACGHCPK